MPPEIAEVARRWLRWADEDFSMAERSHRTEGYVPRGVCMWAHQSAEKSIKALLAAHDIDPPRQHDLARLASRLPPEPQSVFDGIDLGGLSRWAIEGRYPDDFDEATAAEAADALADARAVLDLTWALLRPMTEE